MKDRRKTWLNVGAFALAGTVLTPVSSAAVSAPGAASLATTGSPFLRAPSARLLQLAAEGGEAGEKIPESYALLSANPPVFDARSAIAAYAAGVHANYVAAAAAARIMQAAIATLLKDPTDETLAAARRAWTVARPAYLVTEAYRFYDGPIEDVETRVNAWPVDESYIDYVVGKPNSGIINDSSISLSISKIDALDQQADTTDVTTGWHAIEFLLWGQDLDADGPGNRPVADYFPGRGSNDRRRGYLELVTAQLVSDLDEIAGDWAPGDPDNYATTFLKLPEREALGRMLNGIAVLAGSELMSERIAVGLDSGDQEDEQSCFSDTTHQDFVYDVKGIADVWYGAYAGTFGPGIGGIVAAVDPGLAGRVNGLIDDAVARIGVLGDPWDKVLASPPGSFGRDRGEEAVTALGNLADGLKRVGVKLGVLVQIPSD